MLIATLLKNRAAHPVVAGINYGTALFGAGFVFGVVRTLLITPWLGFQNAVLVELPFMFVTGWIVCLILVRTWSIRTVFGHRLIMSFFACIISMSFEFGLGLIVQGKTLAEIAAFMMSLESRVGFMGQVLVFLFPVLQLYIKVSPFVVSRSRARDSNPVCSGATPRSSKAYF